MFLSTGAEAGLELPGAGDSGAEGFVAGAVVPGSAAALASVWAALSARSISAVVPETAKAETGGTAEIWRSSTARGRIILLLAALTWLCDLAAKKPPE